MQAPLIQFECVTLDEKQQTRYKFLNHIPNHTEVKFADVDLVNIISEKNLDNYNE